MMNQEITFWLCSTIFWTLVMSFYSMQEMACISCNKLRLDYAAAQNQRWALLLRSLLDKPSTLFSTTLIGVNVALMISSESSRRLFEAMGYDPNLAPLFEIPFVLIIGELVPMFAARIYADHSSKLGTPLLYFSSKVLKPVIGVMDACCRLAAYLLGQKETEESSSFLSRDELQTLIQERPGAKETPLHAIIRNIFTLKQQTAFQLMKPFDRTSCISSNDTIGMLRSLGEKSDAKAFCVYHKRPQKIVGMIYPQDILNASDTKRVSDFVESACFVSEDMHALDLLSHLQHEEVNEVIVLDKQGYALGVIILDDLIDELFRSPDIFSWEKDSKRGYLEKTIPADMDISSFNTAYNLDIDTKECTTFAELIEKTLGRHPNVGDTVVVDSLEVVVKETSLFKAKEILIRTKAK